jgi:hypothetical protein
MRKRTLVVTLGAASALTLTGIGVAVADPTTSPSPSPSPSTSAPDDNNSGDRHKAIEQELAGLVQDGTLTQEQVDRVADELDDSPAIGDGWGWGNHDHDGWDWSSADVDRDRAAAAQALGMTTQELDDALSKQGTSLADIAEQRGVPRQTVVDALVASAEEGLAAHVSDGSLTQAQADERRAELPDWAAAAVDGDWWSHVGDHHD